jgi:hypothetical protein
MVFSMTRGKLHHIGAVLYSGLLFLLHQWGMTEPGVEVTESYGVLECRESEIGDCPCM